MTDVLFVIMDIASIDPDDQSLPDGVTPEKVKAGIDESRTKMADRGWHSDLLAIEPTDDVGAVIRRRFADTSYDVAVIGGAIRLPEKNLQLFEQVLNAIRETDPGCAFAFNASLTDMHEAAARWIS